MARKHFDQLLKIYGSEQVLVNLVNRHGYEKPMGEAYNYLIKELDDPNLQYVHFDFHKECSKMRWDRLGLLLAEIDPFVQREGYFYEEVVRGERVVRQMQQGAVRTNCMDCLDRTNVVQSYLARHVLEKQLWDVGVLPQDASLISFATFMTMYRNGITLPNFT